MTGCKLIACEGRGVKSLLGEEGLIKNLLGKEVKSLLGGEGLRVCLGKRG